MPIKLKIATFNLRCNVKADGINMFDFRKGLILDKIIAEQPDIIGFQEMTPPMRDFLKRHLIGYNIIGRSRTIDYQGEHVDIAYKTNTIDLHALDYFWLSPTPDVPGSRYEDQSSCPRITTSGIFKHVESKNTFRVYNTHLDHVGESARILGMKQLCDKIIFDMPVFVTGDMNALPDSAPIQIACNLLTDLTKNIPSSFHGFGTYENHKIDYIFSNLKSVFETVAWTDETNGIYLSDHYPLSVVIDYPQN